jgi:hypothetical protein
MVTVLDMPRGLYPAPSRYKSNVTGRRPHSSDEIMRITGLNSQQAAAAGGTRTIKPS